MAKPKKHLPKLLEGTSMCRKETRNIALMAVESRSKAISALCLGHGKSPCFSRWGFLKLFGPDYPVSVLPLADGQEFLECAF